MAGTYYSRYNARIGIVCDAILYDSFASAADFAYLSPSAGDDELRSLDMFLVVSTWRGLRDDEWLGVGKLGDPMRERLLELIRRCRALRVPTVFYSKEDPPNYGVFIDFARECDAVFTSAEEMVPQYRRDCGHDRIQVLPFCIDPSAQNPVGCRPFSQVEGAIFSGSWMMKYPRRCRDLCALLDGAMMAGRGLCVIDRNSFRCGHSGYRYPNRYREFLRPAMPHRELQALHKSFGWSINVNSVTDSGTMFASRCYELLGCGCPVLSNFSAGMLRQLPEIAIADSPKFAKRLIRGSSPRQMEMRRASGIRRVMTGATCYDRVGAVLRAVGIETAQPRRAVAVVVKGEITAAMVKQFEIQTYADRRIFAEADFSVESSGVYSYVAEWDPSLSYGPFYLQDAIDAFKYTDAGFVVAGGAYFAPVDSRIPGRTIVRLDADVRDGGFGIPLPTDTAAAVDRENSRGHEITAPVEHSESEMRPSVWRRALACYDDNGFWYTVRRIFFGRQY